jgi:hypothetical protein
MYTSSLRSGHKFAAKFDQSHRAPSNSVSARKRLDETLLSRARAVHLVIPALTVTLRTLNCVTHKREKGCVFLGWAYASPPKESAMSFPEFEYKAGRVASDLNTGNAQDAANVLREEILLHPRETGALIDRANHMSAPNRRDDILVDRLGEVAVRDRYTGQETYAGRLPGGFFPPVIVIGGWEWGHHHGPGPFPHPHPGPRPFPHPGHGGHRH